MVMNRADLDSLVGKGCQTPGCTHDDHHTLYLHGRCHLQGRIEVSYQHGSGVLKVACRECGREIARVAVAEPPQ